MYCPKCSAQNETEQKYCRQCGLPFTVLNLALEGRVDEAVENYKKSGGSLSFSTIILALCLLGALINLLLIPGPWNVYAVVANSIVGLVIALPMIIAGHVRLSACQASSKFRRSGPSRDKSGITSDCNAITTGYRN